MTSRIPSVAGPAASETALADGAPLAGYLGAEGGAAGNPSAALDPELPASSNSRQTLSPTSSGSIPDLPIAERLEVQVLRFELALEGGRPATGEEPLDDAGSSSLSGMSSLPGAFATSKSGYLPAEGHGGNISAPSKPAVRVAALNERSDQLQEPVSFTKPVENETTLPDGAGLSHASPPQADPLIASLMASALGIAPGYSLRVEVLAHPQQTSTAPIEAHSGRMSQSFASQAHQPPSGTMQAVGLGDGAPVSQDVGRDEAVTTGQEQAPHVGSGLTAPGSGAHAPFARPSSGAIFQRAVPPGHVAQSTDAGPERVGLPEPPGPELASAIAASVLAPALPLVTDVSAPVSTPARSRSAELAWQQVQAMAQRLAVGRGPEGVHQIRVEIDPRLLPGVQAVMQVMAGQLQLDFVCSNEQSRRRLRVVAQREMTGMASRLGCPVQVTLSTAPTSDEGEGEGGGGSPEYLHAQT